MANKIHSASSSNEPSLVSQDVQFFNNENVELDLDSVQDTHLESKEEKSPSPHSVGDMKATQDDSDTEVEDFDDNQQQQEPRLNNEEQVLPEPSIQNDQVSQGSPNEQALPEPVLPEEAMELQREPVPKEEIQPNKEEQVVPEANVPNDQAMEQMDRIKEMNKKQKRKRLLRSKGAPSTTLVLPSTNQETLANQDTSDKPIIIEEEDSDEAPLRTKRVKSKSVSVEKKRRSARIQSHQTNDLDGNDWNVTSLETNDKKEMDEWNDPKLNRLRRGLPIHYQSRRYRRRR